MAALHLAGQIAQRWGGQSLRGRDIAQIVQHAKKESRSVLMVEQNIAFALRVADFVYVMNKGRIVHQCLPEALRQDEEVRSRYLGVGGGPSRPGNG